MLDVFIRSTQWQADQIRVGFAHATIARWKKEPVNVHIIEARDFSITEGRQFAEQEAQSDPYIYTDDDVVIVGKDWVSEGRKIMLRHEEYAVVSTLSLVETENMARPDAGMERLSTLMEIYPMHWVGAPMWIRKGVLKDWPEMTLGSECGDIHKMVEAAGRKEGLFHPDLRIRHNHLGHGFSSNPNMHWGY